MNVLRSFAIVSRQFFPVAKYLLRTLDLRLDRSIGEPQCNVWNPCRFYGCSLRVVACRAPLELSGTVPLCVFTFLLAARRHLGLFISAFAYLLQCRLAEHMYRRRELHHLIVLLRAFLGTRVPLGALFIVIRATVFVGRRVLLPDRVLAKDVDAQYLRGHRELRLAH